MNLPNQAGRYIAKPANYAVQPNEDATKQGVAWVCLWDLLHYYDRQSGGWVDVQQDGLQITGYHYVIKNDGNPNTTQINQIKAALGWDGRSLSGLESDSLLGLECQLQVKSEEYNNKVRWKADWIDKLDADPVGGGGVTRAEPAVIKSLDAKYGSVLRAMNGANGSPGASQAPTRQATPAKPGDDAILACKRKAWDAYRAKYPGTPADELADAWRQFLTTYDANQDSKSFTASDWVKVQKRIEAPTESPIEEETVFAEDDIPF